jgi:hypothetical protein
MAAQHLRSMFVALLLVTIAAPGVAQNAWRTYHNARFGVSADIPSDWKAGEEPANNDGLVFSSPDGTATITVSGMLVIDGSRAGDGGRTEDGKR